VGKVCAWTEKARIKSLETVGVVRDNALTGKVDFSAKMSDYAILWQYSHGIVRLIL